MVADLEEEFRDVDGGEDIGQLFYWVELFLRLYMSRYYPLKNLFLISWANSYSLPIFIDLINIINWDYYFVKSIKFQIYQQASDQADGNNIGKDGYLSWS